MAALSKTFYLPIIVLILTLAPSITHAIDLTWQKNHQEVKSNALLGQPALIHFWASWCPPCRQEMPAMHAWMTQHPTLQSAIISLDQDSIDAESFLADAAISQPLLFTEPQQVAKLGLRGLPSTIIIDAKGEVIFKKTGTIDWQDNETSQHILQLLGIN
ncbi:MAG: TlpA family protein disulfide reductase [Zetaproteobacteria bacterium]|nr:TlpA family protein disulfide reductase [Zetaproteobacteria bacterium]